MRQAKLHRATVTRAELSYEGSQSIDQELIAPSCGASSNGFTFTQAILTGGVQPTQDRQSPGGSDSIGLNGAAAGKWIVGDLLIIGSNCLVNAALTAVERSRIALLEAHNRNKQTIAG